MKIISFNISPISTFDQIKNFIDTYGTDADFIFMQEVHKKTADSFGDVYKNFAIYFTNNNSNRSNRGLLTLRNTRIQPSSFYEYEIIPPEEKVLDSDSKRNVQHNIFSTDNEKIHLINLHLPVYKSAFRKKQYIQKVINLLETDAASLRIITGDFNFNSVFRLNSVLLNVMEKNGYVNVTKNIPTYRFGWFQLDYFFVKGQFTKVTSYTLKKVKISDHLPLCCEIL